MDTPIAVPLLAELTDAEREQAMQHYAVIAPLVEGNTPPHAAWQAAAEQGHCSLKTIHRWVTQFRKLGLAGLARKERHDQGQRRKISETMQHTIEALYLEHGARTLVTVHRMTKEYARAHHEQVPSYTVVREICRALPPSVVCMARQGPQAWRNQFEPVSHHESTTPNERWQMDHCKVDVLVIDPHTGKTLGRPWLTVALDTYSRAVMGYHLSLETPSAMSICLTLRQAIWTKHIHEWPMCGIPKQLHLDQGKDFTSRHLEQVAADLDIRLIFATPYLARAKGKIERFWETVDEQLWCELPGYVGSNVVQRPAQIEPQLSLLDVERNWLAYVLMLYHPRTHTTTGESPFQRWQTPGFSPRLPPNIRQLDLLLMLSQSRKIQHDGLHLNGLIYWDTSFAKLIDQWVVVRYDPQDLAQVVVYHRDQFVGVASAPELTGLKISLKEWHTLQTEQRKSVETAVSTYRTWLEQERTTPFPFGMPLEIVDRQIVQQRLIAAQPITGPRLFPSERTSVKLITLPEVKR